MATNVQVIEAHKRNPTWTASDIADALKCSSGYVRRTAQRYNLTLPKGKAGPKPNPNARRIPRASVFALGRAARAAGLTIEMLEMLGSSGAACDLAEILKGKEP